LMAAIRLAADEVRRQFALGDMPAAMPVESLSAAVALVSLDSPRRGRKPARSRSGPDGVWRVQVSLLMGVKRQKHCSLRLRAGITVTVHLIAHEATIRGITANEGSVMN
jgi:hypothetical protein